MTEYEQPFRLTVGALLAAKNKPKRKAQSMTESAYVDGCQDHNGICLCCGLEHVGGHEPDAKGYECEDCGERSVYGLEQALMDGMLTFDDEDDED